MAKTYPPSMGWEFSGLTSDPCTKDKTPPLVAAFEYVVRQNGVKVPHSIVTPSVVHYSYDTLAEEKPRHLSSDVQVQAMNAFQTAAFGKQQADSYDMAQPRQQRAASMHGPSQTMGGK